MGKASHQSLASCDTTVAENLNDHSKLVGLDPVTSTERRWQKLLIKPLLFRGEASK